MADYKIFTIGHGGRTLDEIVEQLRDKGVRFVVDVRSQPYSRYQPEFSRDALEKGLAGAGLRYIFMGNQLGGRPRRPFLLHRKWETWTMTNAENAPFSGRVSNGY